MEKFKKGNSLGHSNTWYNSKLFHVNGKPLEFYPKGYNRVEFRSITSIVEAYGGKLCEPGANTLIFTEQDHPIGSYQCYYVKYLRDCIVANKLLDLKKYKLPFNANECIVKEESQDAEEEEEKSDKNIGKPKTNAERREKLVKYYSEAEDRKIIKYIISKKAINLTGSLYFWERVVADNVVNRSAKSLLDHFRKKLIYEYDEYTCNAAACEEFERILENRGKSMKKLASGRHCYSKWSDEENQIMLDYIVKNNLIHRMKGRAVSREIVEKAGLTNRRTEFSVRCHIQKLLHGEYKKYITNPQALREIAAIQINE